MKTEKPFDRRTSLRAALEAPAGALLALAAGAGPAPAQSVELVIPDSYAASGGTAALVAFSASGEYVAFSSTSGALVPGDTNGIPDVFVFRRGTGVIVRVNVTSAGAQAIDGVPYYVSLSATGRFVVFSSSSTNLVPGDTNATIDVFRHDRDADADGVFDEPGAISTIRVNVTSAGAQSNQYGQIGPQAVSADGNRIAFYGSATNLLPGGVDANGAAALDCFVRDVAAGTTTLVSSTAAGAQGNGTSTEPVISADGAFVAFWGQGSNLVPGTNFLDPKIYRKNVATGAIDLVATPAWRPSISETGARIAFGSNATTLVPGDTNGLTDVFVRDMAAGTTVRASVSSGGAQANAEADWPRISENGNVVAFTSQATSLVAPAPTAIVHVYVRDLTTGTTAMADRGATGTVGNSAGVEPALSCTGADVMFRSASGNLGPAVAPGGWHLYVRDEVFAGPGGGPGGTGACASVPPPPPPPPPPPAGPPGVDDNPVTFSVNGPVDLHTDGLASPRGGGLPSGPFAVRAPLVPQAIGIPTPNPGDVDDYAAVPMPAEAELFQSEPVAPVAPPPSGTNNQILVAATCGLVAGLPFEEYHDNIDGASFGEDFFGVTEVSPAGMTAATPWGYRGTVFPEPVVIGDTGTSFRFSVDPFAIGLPATDVLVESGGADVGGGLFYTSPGDAAGDVFGTPLLTLPALPPGGNVLVHDNPLLALAPAPGPMMPFEDDLDALECVGPNDPSTWFLLDPGPLQPGNLHARAIPLEPAHTVVGDLAPPGVANHVLRIWAPIFITVDRASTGAALSAVRTQAMAGEAAGDVFMVYNDPFLFPSETNLLLADEEELGLHPGTAAIGEPTDDIDGLLVLVHPDDRYLLMSIAMSALMSGLVTTVDPTPFAPGSGDEYREGPGFTTSLLKYAYDTPLYGMPRVKIGFSVTTDSIGLEGSAVDFEAGLDLPFAQQSGDVYFTYFGPWMDVAGGVNPAPAIPLGVHWLWHEETSLGLDPGTWVSGVSADLADLPDELNALDSIDAAPGSGTPYGTGCPSASGCTPSISTVGLPAPGNAAFTIALAGAEPGTLAFLFLGPSTSIPFGLLIPGNTCTLLVSLAVQIGPIPVSPGAGCSGTAAVVVPIPATAPSGVTVNAQFVVVQPGIFPAPLSVSMTPGLPITIL
jgi:hypothetical protein